MKAQGWIAAAVAGLLVTGFAFAQATTDAPPMQRAPQAQADTASKADKPISADALSQDEVRKVQSALNQAGHPVGSVDGIWGSKTENALSSFQKSKGLDANGQLNNDTILALGLSRDDFKAASTSTLSEADVRKLQEALNKEGYTVGTVDGVWGPKTESALSDFQRAKGLDATGQVNRDTILALGLSTADFAAGEFEQKEDAPSSPMNQ